MPVEESSPPKQEDTHPTNSSGSADVASSQVVKDGPRPTPVPFDPIPPVITLLDADAAYVEPLF